MGDSRLDLEQGVLASMLMSDKCTQVAVLSLKPDCFSFANHQKLFSGLSRRIKEGALNIAAILDDAKRVSEEFYFYVVELCQSAWPEVTAGVSDARFNYALQELRTKAAQDKLKAVGREMEDLSEIDDVAALGNVMKASIEDVLLDIESDNQIDRSAVLFEVVGSMLSGQMRGLSTGFEGLDRITRGFVKGEFVVLAGRPSMGKSMIAGELTLNVAKTGTPVIFVTLEMSQESLEERWLCSLAGSSPTGADLKQQAEYSSTLPIAVIDKSSATIQSVLVAVTKEIRRQYAPLVVVDYIQLLGSDKKTGSRAEEVTEITKAIKSFARQYNTTVLGLAQLNRGVESRQDKRPLLGDLRESGSLEQDADQVWFLYRDAYYTSPNERKTVDVIELIVAKQRNGATGVVKLGVDLALSRVNELRGY